MPSKPLFGSPVAVGISDAVMAMRNVVSAIAPWCDSKPAASAKVQNALRMSMIILPSDDRKSGENTSKFQASRKRRLRVRKRSTAAACDISRRRKLLKHFRRMLAGVGGNRRQIRKALLDRLAFHGGTGRGVQFRDDIWRRPLGREQAVPALRLEFGKAGLRRSRQIR